MFRSDSIYVCVNAGMNAVRLLLRLPSASPRACCSMHATLGASSAAPIMARIAAARVIFLT
ncbi:uncharacterized protein SOCE26_074360 [Sorangium cellulosum]|uniref:Uncharacterized protein n=1 Tax=Sorangium cellulosum TaxID=56 RepID=A0A2L0F2X6_SORCE|nr:uncharacterized protein SOCE26_074360 [Sorangium cellulosum]